MDDGDEYDWETPIEETPGFLGIVFDDMNEFGDGLAPLRGFDFSEYGILADELGLNEIRLNLNFGGEHVTAKFGPFEINKIVACIPSVEAIYDCPPGQGPAGGAGYIFRLSSGAIEETIQNATVLRAALDADLIRLREMQPDQ